MAYNMLFSPITIKGMTLKNRIVMTLSGSSGRGGPAGEGFISSPQVDFLLRRARGGVGMLNIGVCGGYSSHIYPVLLSDDKFIPRFQRVVEQIHEAGAKVCTQFAVGFKVTKSGGTLFPEDISIEEMKREMDANAAGAVRARKAGVDAVDLKCCHSTIIPVFLSRHWNKRTDEYGGNTEGRMKYPIEVYQAIRQAVGDDFPLGIRLGADEFLPGGNTLTHSRIIARKFAELGLDYLFLSAGFMGARGKVNETYIRPDRGDDNRVDGTSDRRPYCYFRVSPPAWMPEGVNVYLAEDLRRTLRKAGYPIPVMASGRIPHPKLAEEILQDGRADLIGLCRPLMSDPDWAIKAKEGREKEIKRCRYCNLCLAHKRDEQALCTHFKM